MTDMHYVTNPKTNLKNDLLNIAREMTTTKNESYLLEKAVLIIDQKCERMVIDGIKGIVPSGSNPDSQTHFDSLITKSKLLPLTQLMFSYFRNALLSGCDDQVVDKIKEILKV